MSDAAVAERLAAVRQRIAAAALRASRPAQEITLVGVAKRQSAARVVAGVRAGLTHVAESYAQEAREKIPQVLRALEQAGLASPRWHFVGRLQRNKARLVAPLFDVVETLDRASLGDELDRRVRAADRRLAVLLQVNVSSEAQKGGVAPEALPELLAASAAWPSLDVVGLMALPEAQSAPERARPAFAKLRELRDTLRTRPGGERLRELSMGMSADFEVAVEEGATLVRVGTAIFGPRTPDPT